jgi:hypothetical protein
VSLLKIGPEVLSLLIVALYQKTARYFLKEINKLFLGEFANLHKPTVSFVMPASLSVRMEKLSSGWIDFRNCSLSLFRKSIEKIEVLLKSDKNDVYFTRRGHAVAQWLSHCATNRKAVRSIPDGVSGLIH